MPAANVLAARLVPNRNSESFVAVVVPTVQPLELLAAVGAVPSSCSAANDDPAGLEFRRYRVVIDDQSSVGSVFGVFVGFSGHRADFD